MVSFIPTPCAIDMALHKLLASREADIPEGPVIVENEDFDPFYCSPISSFL